MANNQKGFSGSTAPAEGGVTWETLPDNVIPIDDLKVDEILFRDLNDDNGFRLPHGLFVDGEKFDRFTLEPYKAKYDRQLAAIIKNIGRKGFSGIVGNFFPQIVSTIGGMNPRLLAQKTGDGDANRLFNRLTFGDIVTILYQIRVNSQESYDIALTDTCPNCGTKNEDSKETGFHDIGQVKVKLVRDLKQDLQVAVKLSKGIDPGFGAVADIVYMKPIKLHQMQRIADTKRAEDIEMLYQMVSALPQIPEYNARPGDVFGDELYDELGIRDQEILTDAIGKLQLGPEMTIGNTCYACGHEWDVALGMGRLREFLFRPPSAAA